MPITTTPGLSSSSPDSSDVDLDSGPPPSKAPRKAAPTSLFQSRGKDLMTEGESGLGAEGGSQEMLAYKFLGQIRQGVQGLSTIFPGIVPVLSDLTGRLEMIVPSLVMDLQNGGMGMGLIPAGGVPPQMPMGGGMGGPGGMPAPMGPPMPGGGGMPPGAPGPVPPPPMGV